MSSHFLKLKDFLNNGKNFYKIFFFLVVFLCIVKLPSLLTSDIQPWDEGMYATRVLSIHTNGDFIDQSSHSVGGFYSASHPPLLIWIGYTATLIFGVNPVTLKLVIFIFSLSCIFLILLIGKKLFSISTGFFAALIYCSNIIFTVFSQRFQFEIPYTFFILLSFYFVFLYNDTLKFKYIILSGIAFGCCLMTKILVGFYIPIVLTISYFLIRDNFRIKLKDIFILTFTGMAVALPWHIYMIAHFGSEFTDYFFKFHLYTRAVEGVEMNAKNSGMFYHVSYLLSIIPFSALAFACCISYLKKIKSLSWQKIFMLVWFITGLVIITAFRTKLEAYILMIMVPGCFLIVEYINEINMESLQNKTLIILITIYNIIWFSTEQIRPELKLFTIQSNKIFLFIMILGTGLVFYFLSRHLADKIELKKAYYICILIFFFALNVFYLLSIPPWVNGFKLSGVKEYVDNSGNKKIIYIGSNYRFNPQFSFYFNEPKLKRINSEYEFQFADTKEGISIVKEMLEATRNKNYFIIVEKDQINRSQYDSSELFIPAESRLILRDNGYELFEN